MWVWVWGLDLWCCCDSLDLRCGCRCGCGVWICGVAVVFGSKMWWSFLSPPLWVYVCMFKRVLIYGFWFSNVVTVRFFLLWRREIKEEDDNFREKKWKRSGERKFCKCGLLGLSIGRVGSGLELTRTWPDGVEWLRIWPVLNRTYGSDLAFRVIGWAGWNHRFGESELQIR